jgi:hypothetical protein
MELSDKLIERLNNSEAREKIVFHEIIGEIDCDWVIQALENAGRKKRLSLSAKRKLWKQEAIPVWLMYSEKPNDWKKPSSGFTRVLKLLRNNCPGLPNN